MRMRPRAPAYDKVEALHVAGNVYLIAGAGGNIAVSAGGDGIVMVDSGAAAASERVLARRAPDSRDAAAGGDARVGVTIRQHVAGHACVSGTDDPDDHQHQQQSGSCRRQREHPDVSAVPSARLPRSVAEPAGARARRGSTPHGRSESAGPARPDRHVPVRQVHAVPVLQQSGGSDLSHAAAPSPTATAWSGSAART